MRDFGVPTPAAVALVVLELIWLATFGVAVLLVLTGVIALRQRGGARPAEVPARPA
jgi:hypothetical protein